MADYEGEVCQSQLRASLAFDFSFLERNKRKIRLAVAKMQTTICFTNPKGVTQVTQPQAAPIPWWVGSQPLFADPLVQFKSLPADKVIGDDQLHAAPLHLHHCVASSDGPTPALTAEERGIPLLSFDVKCLLFMVHWSNSRHGCFISLVPE